MRFNTIFLSFGSGLLFGSHPVCTIDDKQANALHSSRTDWPRSGRLCVASSNGGWSTSSESAPVSADVDRGQQRDLTKADQRLMRSIASISLLGASSPLPLPSPPFPPPLFDDRLWAPNELSSSARNRFSTSTTSATAAASMPSLTNYCLPISNRNCRSQSSRG